MVRESCEREHLTRKMSIEDERANTQLLNRELECEAVSRKTMKAMKKISNGMEDVVAEEDKVPERRGK